MLPGGRPRELTRTGCEVLFLNHAFARIRRANRGLHIQGVFAEYERALITERTRAADCLPRPGRVNWGGNPPYGSRYLRRRRRTPPQLSLEEREATVVQQITGGCRRTTQLLCYSATPDSAARADAGTNTQGWAQSSVIRILSNRSTQERHGTTAVKCRCPRPRMQTSLKDLRPAIGAAGRAGRRQNGSRSTSQPWSIADLWQMAQEQMAANRTRRPAITPSILISCGACLVRHCGRRLVGLWTATSKGATSAPPAIPRSTSWSCDGRSVSRYWWNSTCGRTCKRCSRIPHGCAHGTKKVVAIPQWRAARSASGSVLNVSARHGA